MCEPGSHKPSVSIRNPPPDDAAELPIVVKCEACGLTFDELQKDYEAFRAVGGDFMRRMGLASGMLVEVPKKPAPQGPVNPFTEDDEKEIARALAEGRDPRIKVPEAPDPHLNALRAGKPLDDGTVTPDVFDPSKYQGPIMDRPLLDKLMEQRGDASGVLPPLFSED